MNAKNKLVFTNKLKIKIHEKNLAEEVNNFPPNKSNFIEDNFNIYMNFCL